MVSRGWTAVNVKEALVLRLKKILQTDAAKTEGLLNISQFVDAALREKIEELERGFLSHINMYDDHVKILDTRLDKLGRIVSVYFKRDGKPYCDYCGRIDCVHVQYAWELPEAKKVLERYGLKPPPSRV